MKKIALVATAVAALCAAPAQADRPADKPAPGSKSKRCNAVKKAFVLKGTQTAATTDAITVIDVKSRNRHARRYLGTATTYDLANAKNAANEVVAPTFRGVTDRTDDGDTVVDMGDVLPTDKVHVKGYITVGKKGGKKKPCAPTTSAVVVKSVTIFRPAPEAPPAS